MHILRLEAADVPFARAYCKPYERFCIPLMARLLAATVPAYAAVGDDGNFYAVFTFSPAGQLFHCLPFKADTPRAAVYTAFVRFFTDAYAAGHAFFSINGEAHGTALLTRALKQACGLQPARRQRYDFMRSPQATSGGASVAAASAPFSAAGTSTPQAASAVMTGVLTGALPIGCKIIRCTPSLAESLFPLQEAYEKEEVVYNLATYNADVSLRALKKNLQEQAVYALLKDGALVAKGGTNAQGMQYVQLGGVYTIPAFRSNGYARALVLHIVRDFAAAGKQVTLFVKPQNAAAVRLYTHCGFAKYGEYESVYF